jgi:glycosyltransferase involved in cell wall biosynthesis
VSAPEAAITPWRQSQRRARSVPIDMHLTASRDLLLDVCVPFKASGGQLFVEAQAYNGVLRWLDNFRRITLCAPLLPDGQEPAWRWVSVDGLLADGRLNVSPFPGGYDLKTHLEHVDRVRMAWRKLIPQHRYLCFSNLGWLGAWGRIGAEEAYKSNRPYSIWLDWVLHEMPVPLERGLCKRAWRRLQLEMLKKMSFRDVRRCSLGLFHGRTVFDAYAAICKTPTIVHDVHLGQEDIISVEALQKRLKRPAGQLRIIYVGRVHEMKGPWQWLDVMQEVVQKTQGSVEVSAEWIGEGPLLGEMRAAVISRGLAGSVSFPGAETDRTRLLLRFREADLFVFCHLAPESPRCLIEALMSGSPIVGFHSAYAADLLKDRPGGILVPLNDTEALARAILECVERPARIAEMALSARSAGCEFSDVAVFRHRSELIKQYL